MDRALAHLLLSPKAFPVIPGAENSLHPTWRDYSLVFKFNHLMDPSPHVVKVFSIEETEWQEFQSTFDPNIDFYGFLGDVELSNGWTGRYSIEFDLGDAIRYIQNFEKNEEADR